MAGVEGGQDGRDLPGGAVFGADDHQRVLPLGRTVPGFGRGGVFPKPREIAGGGEGHAAADGGLGGGGGVEGEGLERGAAAFTGAGAGLPDPEGTWHYFDMVPEEYEIREGSPEFTGRICVIGSKLQEDKLEELFELV